MSSKDAIAEDRRDLQRGLVVNGVGYGLKAAHPVLTVFLVRAYGPEAFGVFLAAQALLLVLTRVCTLGLDKGFLWWVPQQAAGARLRGARAAAAYTFALALVMTLVCLLAAGPIAAAVQAPDAAGALRIMSLALAPMTLMELILGATMGTRRMGINVMVRETLLPMSLVGGGLALSPLALGATGLAIAMVFSHVLGLAVAFHRAREMFAADTDPETELRIPAELWTYTWPMWLAEMANTNLQRLDTWAVAALTDLRTVGIYGVVLQFGNTIRAIRRGFDPIVLAITARIGLERDNQRLAAGYSYATAMVIGTQLPVLGLFIVFARDLLGLYGEEFVVGTQAVVILSSFWVLNSAMSLSGIVISAYGRSRLTLFNTLGAALVQVVLLWFLVPRWGLNGAALAVGLTYTVMSVTQLLQMRVVTNGFHYRRDTLYTILLGAGAALALLLAWFWMPASRTLWMRALAFVVCAGGYLLVFFPVVRRASRT